MSVVMRYEEIERSIIQNQGLIRYGDVRSIEACSYDLRVGTVIKSGSVLNENTPEAVQQGIEVMPGDIVTIITLEEVCLPPNVAGLAFAMNRWSSEGLLVLNPGHVDPGFSGPLSVKALNLRRTPITLRLSNPIFTILFLDFGDSTHHPYTRAPKTRRDYEQEFQTRDREITPTSLSDLLRVMPDLPFVTADQFNVRIWKHWSTYISMLVAVVGLVVAVLALKK
jgi:deoxycytidine triphosphate deaminase